MKNPSPKIVLVTRVVRFKSLLEFCWNQSTGLLRVNINVRWVKYRGWKSKPGMGSESWEMRRDAGEEEAETVPLSVPLQHLRILDFLAVKTSIALLSSLSPAPHACDEAYHSKGVGGRLSSHYPLFWNAPFPTHWALYAKYFAFAIPFSSHDAIRWGPPLHCSILQTASWWWAIVPGLWDTVPCPPSEGHLSEGRAQPKRLIYQMNTSVASCFLPKRTWAG